jgi:hypothetical protein
MGDNPRGLRVYPHHAACDPNEVRLASLVLAAETMN